METIEQVLYKDVYGKPIGVGQIYRNEAQRMKGALCRHENLWVIEEMTSEWIQERNLFSNSGGIRVARETFNDWTICFYRPIKKDELTELLGELDLVSKNIRDFLKGD